MPSKRSKLEIYLDVLKAIRKGTHKPTRVMYRTNLSWRPLMEVLDSLAAQGLISVRDEDNHKVYEVTEKGRNVLNYFSEAMESLKIA